MTGRGRGICLLNGFGSTISDETAKKLIIQMVVHNLVTKQPIEMLEAIHAFQTPLISSGCQLWE